MSQPVTPSTQHFTRTDHFQSPSFPELTCDLSALFDLPLSPEEEQLRVGREPTPHFGSISPAR